MPIPKSQRVVFQKNPLAEVICQLRFPPILEIAATEPAAFQNAIRERYPLYGKPVPEPALSNLPSNVAKLVAQLGLPFAVQGSHVFSTEDEAESVTLTNEFIALSTKQYVRWEDFIENIASIKQHLESVYRPAFYSRLGLRYQDVIDREELGLTGVLWQDLIQPQLLAFLGTNEVKDEVSALASETLIKLPEVIGGKVRIKHGLAERQGDHTRPAVFLFDADFFTDEKCGGSDVITRIGDLHAAAGDLFRWVITSKLHDALEPVPVE